MKGRIEFASKLMKVQIFMYSPKQDTEANILKSYNNRTEVWCGSVVECLPTMHVVLASILSTEKQKNCNNI
jgi:hypothetical protein